MSEPNRAKGEVVNVPVLRGPVYVLRCADGSDPAMYVAAYDRLWGAWKPLAFMVALEAAQYAAGQWGTHWPEFVDVVRLSPGEWQLMGGV